MEYGETAENNIVTKTKRKYTKRIDKDKQNNDNKTEIIKIKGKRGRKPKIHDIILKPVDVIDFMIELFPNMMLQDIKQKTLDELEKKRQRKNIENKLYILDKIMYDNVVYYKDSNGYLFNNEAINIGIFYSNKIYLYKMDDLNLDKKTIEDYILSISSSV